MITVDVSPATFDRARRIGTRHSGGRDWLVLMNETDAPLHFVMSAADALDFFAGGTISFERDRSLVLPPRSARILSGANLDGAHPLTARSES